MQSVFAVLVTSAAVATTAVPANAATWYTHNRGCGTFFTLVCSVQYTGGWPGGQVRGVGQAGFHEVALQTKTGTGESWITRVSTFPGSNGGNFITPAVAVGKFNWYRTCVRTVSGGDLLCLAPQGPIYLGD